MYDVLIKNGKIVDGTGNPWFYADIGIEGEEITKIAFKIDEEAKRVIDAKKRVVSPGFTDAHAHPGWIIALKDYKDWHFSNWLFQGVTTIVAGNCGTGILPNSKLFKGALLNGGMPAELLTPIDWSSLEEFVKLAENRLGINMIVLTGHLLIRESVLPAYPENKNVPTKKESQKMREIVERDLKAGAVGLSSGLSYVPNRFADTKEIVQLVEVVAKYGGIYAPHIRGLYSKEAITKGIIEAAEIGKRTGVPIHIAHFVCLEESVKGKIPRALKVFEEAREEGVDITFDVISYGSHTYEIPLIMSSIVGPPPRLVASKDELAKSWKYPEFRERVWKMLVNVKDGCTIDYFVNMLLDPKNILTNTERPEIEGKSLGEITKSKDRKDILNLLVELFLGGCPGRMTFTWGGPSSDFEVFNKEVAMLLDKPYSMPSSDGSGPNDPARNGFGFIPRFFRNSIERGARMEEVVRKISSFPVHRFQQFDRGILAVGMKADICIFDPNKIRDNCTLSEYERPSGIDFVLVNGSVVVNEGELTDARPGKILREHV